MSDRGRYRAASDKANTTCRQSAPMSLGRANAILRSCLSMARMRMRVMVKRGKCLNQGTVHCPVESIAASSWPPATVQLCSFALSNVWLYNCPPGCLWQCTTMYNCAHCTRCTEQCTLPDSDNVLRPTVSWYYCTLYNVPTTCLSHL